MHVVLASLRVDRIVYDHCNSLHTRADVLRCVLFIPIDCVIVMLMRFSGKELVRQKCKALHYCTSHFVNKVKATDPLMFLLFLLVFVMNLSATLLVFCYAFVPFYGFIIFSHLGIKPEKMCLMIFADVFLLVPFAIIGSLAVTNIINIHLSTTSIIVCFFILSFASCRMGNDRSLRRKQQNRLQVRNMVTSWIFMEYRLHTASLLALALHTRLFIPRYIGWCVCLVYFINLART